jgi:hypothetical protein
VLYEIFFLILSSNLPIKGAFWFIYDTILAIKKQSVSDSDVNVQLSSFTATVIILNPIVDRAEILYGVS